MTCRWPHDRGQILKMTEHIGHNNFSEMVIVRYDLQIVQIGINTQSAPIQFSPKTLYWQWAQKATKHWN